MELLALLFPSFCFLTLSGLTFGAESGPPDTRVIVLEDDDVILPCSLSTNQNIEKELFVWKKEGTVPLKEVFMFDDGTYSRGQDDEFKGRVSHFPEQLKHGNASIRMKQTRLEDNGNYTCSFPVMQLSVKTFRIELVVGGKLKLRNFPGAARKPYVTILKDKGLLQCEVPGASPKPTVEWKDSNGKPLPSKMVQDEEEQGRFHLTIQTTVTDPGCYHCVATQMEKWHQISSEICVHDGPPVIVKEGDDAILPCSVYDNRNIESIPFNWKKVGPAGQKVIFLYDPGNDGRTSQDEQFRGRVSHFSDKLKNGNASITIKNTKSTDNGKYICSFSDRNLPVFLHVDAASGNVMIRATFISVTFGITGIVAVLIFL
ncbi:CD276 antigen-like isoform X1 [Neolamprologus brichardi]|uniref:CD276 antigen-like isoform X1 n=1 Tax=Neolamprologus brichardi TaxID=32507 RepID=UPI0003EC055C|nr:CD276 antigen-like isoform X1 [Neolamprologus brichardi]XP_006809599.1 CD276 antigen-like isoform X1 [Neolamprologus brichardi]